MKAWTLSLIMTLGLVFPAYAEEKAANEPAPDEVKPVLVDKESPIPKMVELRLDEYLVAARMINLPLPGRTQTVQEVLDALNEWAEDDGIGALLLDVGPISVSLPDVEELRAALMRVKKSGKTVRAFINGSSPNGYLLACCADEIAMAPSSSMTLPGLGYLFPFMKGHYQMQGIEFDVITAGKYKYPGYLNQREPNKYFNEEFGAILDSFYEDYEGMIATGRHMEREQVKKIIDTALFNATQAQQNGLVDKIAYYDEYRERILKLEKMRSFRYGEDQLANVNSIQDLVQLINEGMQKAAEARKAIGPKIAVLHARGPIIDYNLGAGFSSMYICRDDFSKVVDELRKNDSIKAVVMHVDSPGGSGYASDVIWTHLRKLDEEKPLVVCMGTVAGSGGYYIACPGRRIFAQPTTLTGSIGVLGIMQSYRSLLNRMDYEVAEMKRGERANLGSVHRELSKEDRDFIQKYMDDFYSVFIDRVATTRKMPAEQVNKIAQGRIWSGRDALEIGLIDELGGLSDAVEAAREMAGIPASAELKIVHYPRPSSLGELFGSLSPVGMTQMVETFSLGNTAAKPLTFDQQLQIFSRRIEPLCWMAVPDIFSPQEMSPTRQNWSIDPMDVLRPQ